MALRILIIGAGVSGLTTGVRLTEAGHQGVIWARARLSGIRRSMGCAPARALVLRKKHHWRGLEGGGVLRHTSV
jgi:pyruvate/2-oxoglutarate dehydrogenase complex dihydrolipoamide dehydrogenase (E3) component